MTDKRKDAMPEIRLIERHGNVEYSYRTNEFITRNEHWIVNGKRFDHAPTGREVEAAYADPSPPVPDDVAVNAAYDGKYFADNHCVSRDVMGFIDRLPANGFQIIRAASTPSAEVQEIDFETLKFKLKAYMLNEEDAKIAALVIRDEFPNGIKVNKSHSGEKS